MKTVPELILESYAARPCFSCRHPGPCGHREYAVEAALIESQQRPKKPVRQETRLAKRKPGFVG